MNPVEVCPICGGSGWKIVERGGISGAEKCECIEAGRALRNEERAGIPPLYRQASVDNFVLPARIPSRVRPSPKCWWTCVVTCANIRGSQSPGSCFLVRRERGKHTWQWRRYEACWRAASRDCSSG